MGACRWIHPPKEQKKLGLVVLFSFSLSSFLEDSVFRLEHFSCLLKLSLQRGINNSWMEGGSQYVYGELVSQSVSQFGRG